VTVLDDDVRVSFLNRPWVRRMFMAIGLALVVWVLAQVPLGDIADAFAQLGVLALITPIFAMLWFASSSAALWNLLEAAVSWRVLYWNRLVGEGYNALVPAAGLGGEPFKLQQLSRYVSPQRAVVALINDRLIENAVAFAFSATCVGIGAVHFDVASALHTAMLTYAGVAWAAAILIVVMTFTDLTGRIGARIAKWIGSDALGHRRLPKRLLVRAFLWTLLARLWSLVEIAFLFALLDLPITLWAVAFTGGAISAAGFIGGMIPQGIGVSEAASVGVFEMLHLPRSAAVAFAFTRRGRQLLTSIAGVVLHVVFGRKLAALEAARIGDQVPT
jgi:hypothetical protein